jgi:hypothetical protein
VDADVAVAGERSGSARAASSTSAPHRRRASRAPVSRGGSRAAAARGACRRANARGRARTDARRLPLQIGSGALHERPKSCEKLCKSVNVPRGLAFRGEESARRRGRTRRASRSASRATLDITTMPPQLPAGASSVHVRPPSSECARRAGLRPEKSSTRSRPSGSTKRCSVGVSRLVAKLAGTGNGLLQRPSAVLAAHQPDRAAPVAFGIGAQERVAVAEQRRRRMAEVLPRLAAHGHLACAVAVEVEPAQRRGLLRERGNEQEQAGEPRGHVHAVVVPAEPRRWQGVLRHARPDVRKPGIS